MNNKEACAEYFKKNQAFDRCFLMMRKKWESYGSTKGKITLKSASMEERKALEGFLARSFEGETPTFTLKEFETALGETRFQGITLEELLTQYFEKGLKTNLERKQERKNAKQEFLTQCMRRFEEEPEKYHWTCTWLKSMSEKRNSGYSILMTAWDRNPIEAEKMAVSVGECLAVLERREAVTYRLAVLAAKITGNPHYFDRGKSSGTLLTHALCFVSRKDFPGKAMELTELYYGFGILMDDLSSTVIAGGFHMETAKGLHPAYEGYCIKKEPCVIAQTNLMRAVAAYGESRHIFIVENEMVFSELWEAVKELPITLLCTSGQPRTAAYVLLDFLTAGDVILHYSGDFDPEGLLIAERIWKKYPEKTRIWRMDELDYAKVRSDEEIDERRLAMLEHLTHPKLICTAKCLKEEKKAGYQEGLLADMERDIRNILL